MSYHLHRFAGLALPRLNDCKDEADAMTKNAKDTSANANEVLHAEPMAQGLPGLFEEMQALLAVMPGAVVDCGATLPTEEEVEAMFDNMPV